MRLLVLLFSLISMMFTACGEHSLYGEEHELILNYQLLKSYFYHPERIREFSEYEGLTEIDSMYSSLNDYFRGSRYTRYYKPEVSEQVYQDIQNSERYYSFGFERDNFRKDTLIVTAVYPISPAASAGLKKHDKLLSANGYPLTGEQAAAYLNSDSLFANPTVFEVLRGTQILALPAMGKKEVPAPTVYLDSLNGIPYITVTRFTLKTNNPNGTYSEFTEYLKEIKGAMVAIIDLRRNGGGSIWHCTAMAAELVPLNNELVYDVEHGRIDGNNVVRMQHYFARDYLSSEGLGSGINWIILMGGGSASCSERFIAAVKYNRPETVIIGQNSYGKGIGQIYTRTYLGGLAYITFLQSFYPNGKTFHEVGIAPDEFIEPGSESDIYIAAIERAARNFDPGMALAKRSFALKPGDLPKNLPPVRKSEKTDLGMYYLLF